MSKFRTPYFLMAAADDNGSDLGGTTIDRGDHIEDLAIEAEEPAAEAQARDESGKFAKSEEPVETKEVKEEPAEKKPRTGKGVIPLDRHEVILQNQRARTEAAESRARALEEQIKNVGRQESMQQLDADIETVEDKLEAARLDGDKEKTRELARQLRMMERQVSINESSRMSQVAKEQAREDMRLDLTIEKLESLYPALAEGNEDYDQDIVDMVLASQRDLIQREKLSPSRALEEATRKVMTKVMPAHRDEVEPEDADKGGLKDAKKTDGGRKGAQVQKNLDTATRQPASLKESGMDSDQAGQRTAIAKASEMSYEEFSALPESVKSRMRGDSL
jgi:hypothetical protein